MKKIYLLGYKKKDSDRKVYERDFYSHVFANPVRYI